MEAKKWYKSKIIWTNIVALIASFIQWKYNIIWDGAIQGMVLTAVNIFLRIITKEEIVW